MRIISGNHKGYRLNPPHLDPTRPTTDFAKEGLFNVINNYFNYENIVMLDLFGGTGGISFEFASRGCTDITTVEMHKQCVDFIRKTSATLKLQGHNVIQGDVFTFIENAYRKYDFIFAGPPYPLPTLATIPDKIFEHNLIDGKGWFIMEHNPKHNFESHPHFWKTRNYGTTIFTTFVNDPANY